MIHQCHVTITSYNGWFAIFREYFRRLSGLHTLWWLENGRGHESCNDDAEDLSFEVAHEPIANLDWLDFRTEKVS